MELLKVQVYIFIVVVKYGCQNEDSKSKFPMSALWLLRLTSTEEPTDFAVVWLQALAWHTTGASGWWLNGESWLIREIIPSGGLKYLNSGQWIIINKCPVWLKSLEMGCGERQVAMILEQMLNLSIQNDLFFRDRSGVVNAELLGAHIFSQANCRWWSPLSNDYIHVYIYIYTHSGYLT